MAFSDIRCLRGYLLRLQEGEVGNDRRLRYLLTQCEFDFEVSPTMPYTAYDIFIQAISITWYPPVLQFELRVGGFWGRNETFYLHTEQAKIAEWFGEIFVLEDYLRNLSDGPILELDRIRIEEMLAERWDEYSGAKSGGMTANKILGRTESLMWKNPCLSFQIRRHPERNRPGAKAIFVDMQEWQLNIDTQSAQYRVLSSEVVGWEEQAI